MDKISRRKFIWGGIGLIISATALDAFWYEKVFIELNEFYLVNAGPNSKNLKVLQISDIHLHRIQVQTY